MPAPLAKGIIIAASVIVAAGIAFYENPQVRQWVDNSRRKIAQALHTLGEEIQPQASQNAASNDPREVEEQRRRQREELVRRNRARLYNEGTGTQSQHEKSQPRADARKSFDTLVGNDGMLKNGTNEKDGSTAATQGTSVTQTAAQAHDNEEGLRRRMQGVRGLERGAVFANPFADEEGQVLFDRSLISAEQYDIAFEVNNTQRSETRETSATLNQEQEEPLIDLAAPANEHQSFSSEHVQPQVQQEQGPLQYSPGPFEEWADTNTASFYSLSRQSKSTHGSGTATPTEDNFSESDSLAGSGVAMDRSMSLNSSVHGEHPGTYDALSDAFSDLGVHTPGSWTDVGSDAGSEDNEHVSLNTS